MIVPAAVVAVVLVTAEVVVSVLTLGGLVNCSTKE